VIDIKSKTILLSLVIISLFFITPYVESFSIGDLGDMVGYALFNSFKIISGNVVNVEIACDYSDDVGGCAGGGGSPAPISYCGDGTCDGDESYAVCSADCELDCSILTCQDNWGICGGQETIDCEGNQICGVDLYGECDAALISDCGDGIVNNDEECDENLLDGSTCISLGFDFGTLSCNSDCTFDEDQCYNDDNSDTGVTPPDDKQDVGTALTCAAINGICTNGCGVNYEHYDGNTNLDRACVRDYGNDLVCCVPSYIINTGYSGGDSDQYATNEDGTFTGKVKSVEDYMIQKEQEAAKSAPSYSLEGGLQQILTSPAYAMGGVWIIFVLTAVVIGLTYYLHSSVAPKIRKRRKMKR